MSQTRIDSRTASESNPGADSPVAIADAGALRQPESVLLETEGDLAWFRMSDPNRGEAHLELRTAWIHDDSCKRIEHEFDLRHRLQPEWALVPSRLQRTDEGPALVYPDSSDISFASLANGTLEIGRLLLIAARAAGALARLHESRLLHCDLRPSRLVWDGRDHVRLRSFMLARERDDSCRLVPPPRSIGFAYASPEQLSPQNAYVDERSDLYSFGITLFELLTGALPFSATSHAEWLHAHVAVIPQEASAVRRDTPEPLNTIILTLIAKDPADRYQSAAALEADLSRCLDAWTQGHAIPDFQPASIASARRLSRRATLFGRDDELRRLADAHSRVARAGDAQLVLLSGPPGAGKTALASEFESRLREKAAVFATGKPDQYQPATPYAPVVQALRALVVNALGWTRSAVDALRARMLDYPTGQIAMVVDLVPELELIVGELPGRPHSLTGQVPGFVQRALIGAFVAFGRHGSPVVLFLDDLQWADDASLAFVEMLVRERPSDVLVVGAFRDDESTHSSRFAEFLRNVQLDVTAAFRIALTPLRVDDTRRLLGAALGETDTRLDRLARLVHAKTRGNPFHANQLLRTLVDESVIRFDHTAEQWTWNWESVVQHRETDSIVELLIARLGHLSTPVRDLLRLSACIGVRTDEALLSRVSGVPAGRLLEQLEPAQRAGLIVATEDGWSFAHDRIQEASYALTDPANRPSEHARIALAMIDLWRDRLNDVAFAIASQIELSDGAQICDGQNVTFTAALICAAERAVSAAARPRALQYLEAANRLLGADRWSTHYAEARRIGLLRCECLLGIADLDGAALEIDALFAALKPGIDMADAYRLKAALLTVSSDYRGAVAIALSGLDSLGVSLPATPSPAQVRDSYQAVMDRLAGRPVSELIHLPKMTDPHVEAAVALLTALEASIFYQSNGLTLLHFATMVRLTLEHGVTAASVQGLAWFGVYIADLYDEPEKGLDFAEAALALVERHGYERYRTATLVALDQVAVWTRPLDYALGRAREAKAAGNQSAELRWLCYSCNHIISDLLVMGADLEKVRAETDALVTIARGAGYDDIVEIVSTQAEFVASLQHEQSQVVGTWEPAHALAVSAGRSTRTPMATLQCWTYVLRGQAAFLLGDLELAARSFDATRDLTWASPAHIHLSDYRFYAALTATQASAAFADGRSLPDSVADHRQRFAVWAQRNPGTFRNKLVLIDAELARLAGDHVGAMRLYDEAANLAASADFVHEQALAYELAARHADAVGLGSVARHYLRLALASYRRWGAHAKVLQLETKHPFLAARVSTGEHEPTFRGQKQLDFDLAMKTAQALSEEIDFPALIDTLMKSMIVHAGARYGLLVLMRDGEPFIEAAARVVEGVVNVELRSEVPTDAKVPLSILYTVMRTRQTVVFDDADSQARPQHEISLAAHHARSILCLPLMKQGALVGVLYLENNLATSVFAPQKIAMLEILAPQAANALETTCLYARLLDENTRRRETEMALRQARGELARTAHLTVLAELAASIAHEVNQPLTSIVSNVGACHRWLQLNPPDLDEVRATLEDIRSAGVRAADVVRSIRALAKQAPAALAPVRVDDLVSEVLALTAVEIEAKHVRLIHRSEAGDVHVLADPTQIKQVVLNLITNALDAMTRETGKRELAISSSVHDGWVAVRVKDTGPGIPEAIRDRVFEPFFTTKDSGMGMGLAICRSIMEAHGGTLEASSESCDGTALVFRLPATQP
ncbi:hypothetical protein WK59_22950 [Burkholderia ubonensis]|uniref:ATP-binding sensor histidine kinase n=1 Tax=Burkholderia ubonensis TaxID=101571 RepID=UPI00075CEA4E|nr:ATP-binding sensor histidine kinase [Burkholderia ubonensis]KVT79373.1 hypothetical protein WK59_22950 [Burkholderia ubonensis]